MRGRPRFKADIRVDVVPPDLVFLSHDTDYAVLEGRLYALLAPLLNARNTAADIADKLEGSITVLDVDYGLSELRRRGYLAAAADEQSSLHDAGLDAGFWRRLQRARVSVRALGALAQSPAAAKLRSAGVRPARSRFDLVVVDDYLCEELEGLNRRALRRRRPWMLVKPVGSSPWVGPIFNPPHTGCWACLTRRLREHRPVEAYVEARGVERRKALSPSLVIRSPGWRAAWGRALAEAVKWSARGKSSLEAALITVDAATRKATAHEFIRWETCSACGSRRSGRRAFPPSLVLQRRAKVRADESGERSARPEETFARLRRHISPVTGIVHELRPYYSDKSGLVHVYLARHAYPPGPAILSAPAADLYWRSWGKGTTALQAKTSALCEALERYSGVFRGTEPRKRSSYRALEGDAIHPNACLNFSERQYRARNAWNRREARHNWVPQPFDENRTIDWTPVWSLTEKRFKYVPTAYCYYGYPVTSEHDFCRPDSNGNAAGSNLEEAILQGFLELVERDCVAIWWYNRLPRPEVNLGSFHQRYFEKLQKHYQRQGRRLWVLDLTHDFGIPAFAALSRQRRGRPAGYLFGFGAHFDPAVAILRALTEMNQFLSSVARDRERQPYSRAALDETFLVPDSRARPRRLADYPRRRSHDLREEVNACARLAQERGLEMLALDQTRPDAGVAVAKVIVPGLRQFWARFAPGRLYEVPVHLGWRKKPLRENELNPVHLYM